MTDLQWNAFIQFRMSYKKLCDNWNNLYSESLKPLQKAASEKDTPVYSLENAVVYNTAFDAVQKEDDIKLILVGDNPGKKEQLTINRKYLVGQSGKLAEGFFLRNPELGIDFRKNVLIMNKTPVHTAKTKHLSYLKKNGEKSIQDLIEISQKECACLTALLQKRIGCPLWLVGYAELKDKGLFTLYRDTLLSSMDRENLFVYQHFSMNCFTKDLKKWKEEHKQDSLQKCLLNLGKKHRDEIFL